MNLLIWVLAIGIAIFQFVDWRTTTKILANGGTELNPFMRLLFDWLGMKTGLFLAKFYVVVFAITGAFLGWFESKTGFILLAVLFAIYGAVVNHNLKE